MPLQLRTLTSMPEDAHKGVMSFGAHRRVLRLVEQYVVVLHRLHGIAAGNRWLSSTELQRQTHETFSMWQRSCLVNRARWIRKHARAGEGVSV